MSGRIAREMANVEHRLPVTLIHCSACGHSMPVAYTKTRKRMTMSGLVQLRLQIRRCQNGHCDRFHKSGLCRGALSGLDRLFGTGNWRCQSVRRGARGRVPLHQSDARVWAGSVPLLPDPGTAANEQRTRTSLWQLALSRAARERPQGRFAIAGAQWVCSNGRCCIHPDAHSDTGNAGRRAAHRLAQQTRCAGAAPPIALSAGPFQKKPQRLPGSTGNGV